MIGCHYQSNGRELGQIPGDGEGQGGLGCCSPWGRTVLVDMTSLLNNTSLTCFVQNSLPNVLSAPKCQPHLSESNDLFIISFN